MNKRHSPKSGSKFRARHTTVCMSADLMKKGKTIGVHDLIIGATALSLGYEGGHARQAQLPENPGAGGGAVVARWPRFGAAAAQVGEGGRSRWCSRSPPPGRRGHPASTQAHT